MAALHCLAVSSCVCRSSSASCSSCTHWAAEVLACAETGVRHDRVGDNWAAGARLVGRSGQRVCGKAKDVLSQQADNGSMQQHAPCSAEICTFSDCAQAASAKRRTTACTETRLRQQVRLPRAAELLRRADDACRRLACSTSAALDVLWGVRSKFSMRSGGVGRRQRPGANTPTSVHTFAAASPFEVWRA